MTTIDCASDKIDAYILRQQDFARPILNHVRARVKIHIPDAEEALKWGMPAWTYKGKLLCSMAAFKAHATFGFWHGALVTGNREQSTGAMGSFGKLASVEDLPPDSDLARMFATARRLIDEGVPPPHVQGRGKHAKPELKAHPAFEVALRANPQAQTIFEGFSRSAQREYLEWIDDAKRDETRDKRVAQAIEWLAEGKKRNWKYENC